MDDDEFWTTFIASTPEQDGDFAGCGWWLLLVVSGFLGVVLTLKLIL